MRTPTPARLAAVGLAGLLLAGAATACGSKSSTSVSPSSSGGSSAGGATTVCAPQSGTGLVTLADDRHLQSSDNIVPVVRTAVAKAPLTDVLNKVSAALTQEKLNDLNKQTDVERESSQEAAQNFVSQNGLGSAGSGGSGAITVIAANFSESQTLAYVYADALKGAGYSTSVKQSTNREVYLKSVETGEADVVPDYAATLTTFLDTSAKASSDITQTLATLKPIAAAKGLTVLDAAPATDENAFAVTKAFAQKYGVTTLSQLATACGGGLTLGGPPECSTRAYCEPGLAQTYGLKFTSFTPYDAGGSLSKNALKQGKVALALVFSSDSSVSPAS